MGHLCSTEALQALGLEINRLIQRTGMEKISLGQGAQNGKSSAGAL